MTVITVVVLVSIVVDVDVGVGLDTRSFGSNISYELE